MLAKLYTCPTEPMDAPLGGVANNEIVSTIGMPRSAMGFSHISRYASLAATYVDSLRNRLQMIRVDATPVRTLLHQVAITLVMAGMVNLQPVWDFPLGEYVGVSMSGHRFLLSSFSVCPWKNPVSTSGFFASPIPATVRFFYEGPKSLNRIGSLGWSIGDSPDARLFSGQSIHPKLPLASAALPAFISALICIPTDIWAIKQVAVLTVSKAAHLLMVSKRVAYIN